MYFKIVGTTQDIETIASGNGIHELKRLRKQYGPGRWLKRKGRAKIQLPDQPILTAEIHWYEAHGIGKKEIKIKRFLAELT
jgi:hypothetical protein